jgi:hypothetical protein
MFFAFGADKAVLLVYDVTNRKSFADLSLWLEEFGCGPWMSSAEGQDTGLLFQAWTL